MRTIHSDTGAAGPEALSGGGPTGVPVSDLESAPRPQATGTPARSHNDDAWFNDIFNRHGGDIFRYFVRRAKHDDAEDLAAEVFATAWRRRDDVPAGAELPWMYRTAGYVLANHRRKGRPIPVGDVPEESELHDASDAVVESAQVRQVLAKLSAKDRQVLLLAAWEGLKGAELAEVLGISRGAADAALFRARTHLNEAWSQG